MSNSRLAMQGGEFQVLHRHRAREHPLGHEEHQQQEDDVDQRRQAQAGGDEVSARRSELAIEADTVLLAMGFVGTGFALLLTGGDRIRVEDELFRSLLTVRFLQFPLMVYVALAFLLVAWFIQSRTTLGRNFYAVGGGEELAHASGLNVERVRIMGFTLAGIFFAVGALLAVGRIGIAETATGNNFMFVSITAVVVGGTALWGGIGGVWNTLIGVLIVNVIDNGMVVIGLPNWLQDGVLGLLVIIAVVLSTDRKSISFVK